MKIDLETAQNRINELEAQLEDAHVTIDLVQEALNERDDELRSCKAQLLALNNAQKVDYQVG